MNLTENFLDRYAKDALSHADITVAVQRFSPAIKDDAWPENMVLTGTVTRSSHPAIGIGETIMVRMSPDCMDRDVMLTALAGGSDILGAAAAGDEIEFQNCEVIDIAGKSPIHMPKSPHSAPGQNEPMLALVSTTGYNPQTAPSAKTLSDALWTAEGGNLICYGHNSTREIIREPHGEDELSFASYTRGNSWRNTTDTDLHNVIRSVDEACRNEWQLAALPPREVRPYPEGRGPHSPWGSAQYVSTYAEGLWLYETASHGGFLVSPALLSTFPPELKTENGWYEEDCDWSLVAIALRDHDPAIFTEVELIRAERVLRNWHPDAWETVYGRELQPGESHIKDREARDAAAAKP